MKEHFCKLPVYMSNKSLLNGTVYVSKSKSSWYWVRMMRWRIDRRRDFEKTALQTSKLSNIKTKALCVICEKLRQNQVAHIPSPMNSVISRLRSEKVKGDSRLKLFFLLTTYGIIMVNNSLTLSCSLGYLFGTNYCNIGQINRQVKVNYMMIILMIHGDPKNFNFVCVVYPMSIVYFVRTHGVSIFFTPDFAWSEEILNWFDAR